MCMEYKKGHIHLNLRRRDAVMLEDLLRRVPDLWPACSHNFRVWLKEIRHDLKLKLAEAERIAREKPKTRRWQPKTPPEPNITTSIDDPA